MAKIKLYLIKLHNKLIYEVVSIDNSICGKVSYNHDDRILLASKESWVDSDRNPTYVRVKTLGIDYKEGLYLNFKTINNPHTIHFSSNEERDIWYSKIIKNINSEWY